jgi:hypothetical protein
MSIKYKYFYINFIYKFKLFAFYGFDVDRICRLMMTRCLAYIMTCNKTIVGKIWIILFVV